MSQQFGSQQPWVGSGRLAEGSAAFAYASQLGSQSQDTLYSTGLALGPSIGLKPELGLQKNGLGAVQPRAKAFPNAPGVPNNKPFTQHALQRLQGGSQKPQLNLVLGGASFGRLPSPGPNASQPSPSSFQVQLASSQGSLLDTTHNLSAPQAGGAAMFMSSQHKSIGMTQATMLCTSQPPALQNRPTTGISTSHAPIPSRQQLMQRPGSVNSSMDATTGSQGIRPQSAPEPSLLPVPSAPFKYQQAGAGAPANQQSLGRALASEVELKRIGDALEQIKVQMSGMQDNQASLAAGLSALSRDQQQVSQLVQEGHTMSRDVQQLLIEAQVQAAAAQGQRHQAVMQLLDAGVQTSPGLVAGTLLTSRRTSTRVVRHSCRVDTTYVEEEVQEEEVAAGVYARTACRGDGVVGGAGEQYDVRGQQYGVQLQLAQQVAQQTAVVNTHLLTNPTTTSSPSPLQQPSKAGGLCAGAPGVTMPAGEGWVQRKRGAAAATSQLTRGAEQAGQGAVRTVPLSRGAGVQPGRTAAAVAVDKEGGGEGQGGVSRKRAGEHSLLTGVGGGLLSQAATQPPTRSRPGSLAGLLSSADLGVHTKVVHVGSGSAAGRRLPSLHQALVGSAKQQQVTDTQDVGVSGLGGLGAGRSAGALTGEVARSSLGSPGQVTHSMSQVKEQHTTVHDDDDDEELARQVAERMQRHRARRQRRL